MTQLGILKSSPLSSTRADAQSRCLHDRFSEQVRIAGDRIAARDDAVQITYAELDERAEVLAGALIEAQVAPRKIVALFVERGVEMLVGMMAILKAGGAFLPIDSTTPIERALWMMEDSGAEVVLTSSQSEPGRFGYRKVVPISCVAQAGNALGVSPHAKPSDLAYIIYTSGSTGKPKGVMVTHANVDSLFRQTADLYQIGEHDVWSCFHSISFDFSVWEIWGALLFGGRVEIISYAVSRSPVEFAKAIKQKGITILSQTPTAFRHLLASIGRESVDFPALRWLIFGGERLIPSMLRDWFDIVGDSRIGVANMYGITETTVHASHRSYRKADLTTPQTSFIGAPLVETKFLVLDGSGQEVERGQPGELYISGPGVAAGYLNCADLTSSRFLDIDGVRHYRSGDLVLKASDGEYIYLGRADDQLKVRGFRIEPGEVEVFVNLHREISASLVTSHDFGAGDERLIVYLVPRSHVAVTTDWLRTVEHELRADAARKLPAHMRPSQYIFLSSFPMTANGKVDRAALPRPAALQQAGRESDVPQPGASASLLTSTEQAIAEVWSELLEVSELGREDDFFDVGGTSLTLVRMIQAVNARLGTELDLVALVEGATIHQIAKAAEAVADVGCNAT